jgi:hypothetical protein
MEDLRMRFEQGKFRPPPTMLLMAASMWRQVRLCAAPRLPPQSNSTVFGFMVNSTINFMAISASSLTAALQSLHLYKITNANVCLFKFRCHHYREVHG